MATLMHQLRSSLQDLSGQFSTKLTCHQQDFDSILATVGTNFQNFVDDSADITEGDETPEFSNIIEGDYLQLLEEKNIDQNAITYVTGYLAKKCLQKHPCVTCTNAVTNNVLDSPDKRFTFFKSFDRGPRQTAPLEN